MSVRLLLLDNALDHSYYRPREHWQGLCPQGIELESVHAAAGEPLPEPGFHTHVIVSGSEASITVRDDWAEREAAWLRKAAEAGARMLGSCWGHQLLAVAFFGPGAVRRPPTPEFGWLEVDVHESGQILPAGAFHCFAAHFDEVVAGCHPDLKVLASTPGCEVAAMRVGDLRAWGIQPHPEVDPATGRAFLEGGRSRWPAHAGLFESALEGPVADDGLGREILRNFLAT